MSCFVQVFASSKKLAAAPHPDDVDPHAQAQKSGPFVGAAVAAPNSSGRIHYSSFMGVVLAALAALVAVLL